MYAWKEAVGVGEGERLHICVWRGEGGENCMDGREERQHWSMAAFNVWTILSWLRPCQ